MPPNITDASDEDLKECEGKPSIVGEFNCDEIYVDAFSGWIYEDSQQDAELCLAVLKG